MSERASSQDPIPVAVLGGTGYVAGELLRLLSGHPRLRLVCVVSTSQSGEKLADVFPHLAGASQLGTSADGMVFESIEDLLRRFEAGRPLGIFAATPHGATAQLLDRVLSAAERTGADVHAVDISADFRFPDPARYQAIYGLEHPAPGRLASFRSALPEQASRKLACHAAQPGCFATAVTLAALPFWGQDLIAPDIFVAAVTGSSGSGRKLSASTHHPDRRSNLFAYSPLAHRHEPEMRRLLGLARGGMEPDVQFVPHSGPFVRGIHATLRMTLKTAMPAQALLQCAQEYYAGSPFISASLNLPSLTEVVGTNRCRLGVAARGNTLVVTSVIDNLVKGAAGGAVQWMNRLFDLQEDAGLRLPGLGWF
jgi:N-acetyl-gamma-glutamyl-phosphate reductase